MPWWAFLLIALGLVVLGLVLGYFLFGRRLSDTSFYKSAIASEKKRHAEELAAEQERAREMSGAIEELKAERSAMLAWYGEQKDKIDEDAQTTFETLATDGSALDARLDALLGFGPGEEEGGGGQG
jgi:hypothetical protein